MQGSDGATTPTTVEVSGPAAGKSSTVFGGVVGLLTLSLALLVIFITSPIVLTR
jgi:hypothetical protein